MKRRVLGIIAAIVLALIGTIALVAYVQSARDDVAEPEPVTEVVLVREPLRQGASLGEIRAGTAIEEIPTRLVADGALTSLDGLRTGLVAAVDLRPGEQLLRARLVEPDTLVRVDVPEGLQEITIALDPERAVGGVLRSGSLVGVVLSFDPFELSAAGAPAAPDDTPTEDPAAPTTTAPRRTPNMTHLTLDQILVTSVQFSRADAERATETRSTVEDRNDQPVIDATIAESPRDRLLVTLAVTAPEVEQIVFAAEFGRIWLTAQSSDTDLEGSRILTLDQIYVTIPRP